MVLLFRLARTGLWAAVVAGSSLLAYRLGYDEGLGRTEPILWPAAAASHDTPRFGRPARELEPPPSEPELWEETIEMSVDDL